MSSELVERLRNRAESYRMGGPSSEHTAALLDEAAARIEALEAALAKIEWALTKQSLTDKERVQDALSVARRAREGGNADG